MTFEADDQEGKNNVMSQFEITPKALANVSPGFEEREPWVRFP